MPCSSNSHVEDLVPGCWHLGKYWTIQEKRPSWRKYIFRGMYVSTPFPTHPLLFLSSLINIWATLVHYALWLWGASSSQVQKQQTNVPDAPKLWSQLTLPSLKSTFSESCTAMVNWTSHPMLTLQWFLRHGYKSFEFTHSSIEIWFKLLVLHWNTASQNCSVTRACM